MAEPSSRLSSFADYTSVLHRRKWIILGLTFLVTLSAVGLSFLQTPAYEGRARLLIQRGQSIFNPAVTPRTDTDFLESQMQVIQGQEVRDVVRTRLGRVPPPGVSQVGQTSMVDVRAEGPSPERAADTANAYVEAYLEVRGRQVLESQEAVNKELQNRIEGLERDIQWLSDQLANAPNCSGPNPPAQACSQRESIQQDRDALVSQLVPFKQRRDQLQVDASVMNLATEVISRATPSDVPVRPNRVRNGILGLVTGLVAGVALAFAREHFDESISDKEDLERASRGIPVLGIIPAQRRDQPVLVSSVDPSSGAAEAYRILRTSIQFRGLQRSRRLLQITSPGPGEGKTVTAANLGFSLARAGERVVLVNCDLRRPRLHSYLEMSSDVGFTSVLLGNATLASALQVFPGEERLSLLASGPIPPDPAELLASGAAETLLNTLGDEFDTVIIDSPPVLPVTDAVVLSTIADGTLMVVLQESTGRKQVARSLELLEQVDARVIGTVLRGVADDGTSAARSHYYSSHKYAWPA